MLNIIKINSVVVFQDRVPVGRHQENADYTNPQGYYYGNRFFIKAATSYGDTYVLASEFIDEDYANHIAAMVEEIMEINTDHWASSYPVYGSAAYCDEEPYLVAREREDALNGMDLS